MKLISIVFVFSLLLLTFLGQSFTSKFVYAQNQVPPGWEGLVDSGEQLPKLPASPFGCNLNQDTIFACAGKILLVVLRFIMLIAIVISAVLIAVAGVRYMTGGGEGGKGGPETAKTTIINAVIGLVIALLSWILIILISRFVIK